MGESKPMTGNVNRDVWRAAILSRYKEHIILDRSISGNINVRSNGVSIGTIYKAVAIFKADNYEAQFFGVDSFGTIGEILPKPSHGNAAALPKTN